MFPNIPNYRGGSGVYPRTKGARTRRKQPQSPRHRLIYPARQRRNAECTAAAVRIADGRHTMGVTAVVRAADGRRTTTFVA